MRDSVKLLEEEKNYCRLNGYFCADESRKIMALGFNFNKTAYVSKDIFYSFCF